MSFFAKLDKANIVIDIATVSDNIATPDNLTQEQNGIEFLTEWSGGYTNWKQTSYNAIFRKNYAGIGYSYSVDLDAFVPPKPYPSWLLNTNTCRWEPPIPYPNDGNLYTWDEATQSWVLAA